MLNHTPRTQPRLETRGLCLRVFFASLVIMPGALAQDDLQSEANRIVTLLEQSDLINAWDLSLDLVDLDEEAIPAIREHLQNDSAIVRVSVCRALIELNDVNAAAKGLIRIIDEEDDKPLVLRSIELLGRKDAFREHSGVSSYLAKKIETELDPQAKISLARSLYSVSSSIQDRMEAKNVLNGMLRSDDRMTRVSGALALAEIGDYTQAKPILLEIQGEPTAEGRMARLYLKRDNDFREMQRLHRKLQAKQSAGEYGTQPGDISLILELMELIQELHLRGEEFRGPEGTEKLLAAAARGMLNSLDPHSTYFTPQANERWTFDLNREYGGIGAYVDTIDNVFTIVRPIYSGPAYEAGLKSGDQIWKVDGWETFNQENEEIIRRLKGPPGTSATVTIFRQGWQKERDFTISRELINVPSVNYELFPGNIGYVEIMQFARTSNDELTEALDDLESRGMESLILDVRNNTGGYLDTAVDIVGQFVGGNKLVVYTEGRREPRRDWETQIGSPQRPDYPMVVLTNHRSASASEILAGALQHYDRAVVVGNRTFGKGSVQNPVTLRSRPFEGFADENGDGRYDSGEEYDDLNANGKRDMGGLIKITTARYFLPSGVSIHTERDADGRITSKGGVEPNIEVELETIKPWKEEELADLIGRDVFRDYVDKHYETHRDLFVKLAEGDQGDINHYPEFDTFMAGLETHLDRDDIRRWIRVFMREKVSDERGKTFPGGRLLGDYQEDTQLQKAIAVALDKTSRDVKDVEAYSFFADKVNAPPVEDKEVADSEEGDGEGEDS